MNTTLQVLKEVLEANGHQPEAADHTLLLYPGDGTVWGITNPGFTVVHCSNEGYDPCDDLTSDSGLDVVEVLDILNFRRKGTPAVLDAPA